MATTSRSIFWLLTIVWLTTSTISSSLKAQDIANGHCLYGCPIGAGINNNVVIRPIYTVSYNSLTKSADWVAYTVSANSIGIASNLSREWKKDEFVDETLSLSDFAEGSKFEFARLVPIVDFAGTPFWQDANYLTNFVPRTSNLNQGAWYGLNWATRNAVNRLGEVYIIAGPIYYQSPVAQPLNTKKVHRVPDAFFKIVLTENGGLSVFLLDQNTPVHVHHCDLESDLERIETLTGLEIFPTNRRQDFESIRSSLGCF
ncbi:MAG: endonuclease G [Pseudohongiellaceae bacterium]|jgi:endonuclease G